ncbi:unnamed protein product [Clonostachys rosea]|uniref:Uncharacterized protein n=1 Tax=Bionectria ochroleuca TaxID=29856 RepID=A0ABY6ULQ4_BIOOC|nr:unnamed protein product [Clonostachys rosea]
MTPSSYTRAQRRPSSIRSIWNHQLAVLRAAQYKPHQLLMLGGCGVGKTALACNLILDSFVEDYEPTIENCYRKTSIIDGRQCIIEILDTAGEGEMSKMRYMRDYDSHAAVLVYSISSRASFNQVRDLCLQIRRAERPAMLSEGYPVSNSLPNEFSTAPYMLIGNMSDKTSEREVSTKEGQLLAHELGCGFVETSAKTGANVEKAFYDVVRALRQENRNPTPPRGSRLPMPNLDQLSLTFSFFDWQKVRDVFTTDAKY